MYNKLCNRDGMSSKSSVSEREAVLKIAHVLGFDIVSKTFKDGEYVSKYKHNGGIVFKDINSENRFKGCTDDEINRDCTLDEMIIKMLYTAMERNNAVYVDESVETPF